MDTKKIMRAIGGGFAGFLLLLGAHGVLLFALIASITFLSGPKISSLSWFLFIIVIPPLITVAAALPAIGLGFGKKFSLITGFIAFILASIIITHPLEKSGGLFNMTSTLASIIPVGTTMLAISFRLPEGRKRRVGIILGIWMVFSQYRVTCYSVFRTPSRHCKKAESDVILLLFTLAKSIDKFYDSKLRSIAYFQFRE